MGLTGLKDRLVRSLGIGIGIREKANFTMILAFVFFIANPFMGLNLNDDGNNKTDFKIEHNDQDIAIQGLDPFDLEDMPLIKTGDQFGKLLPSAQNGSFQYPRGSSIIPMGIAQNQDQRRNLYKELFNRIYHNSDVEVIMDDFYYNGIKYPAGTLASMNGFGGSFNYTIAAKPFNVTKGYSLHPRSIAVFKSDVLDGYGQNVTWEQGYFERIFRVYLWGNYFDRINETGIRDNDVRDYDIIIIPSIKKGYEKAVAQKLGSKGLNKLRNHVRKGNFLYTQGGGCYIAEAARLVPKNTVLLDERIDSKNNHADMVVVNNSYPMAHSWLSHKMYVIDDPVLNATDTNAVVAKYTGNITNSSLINTSAIMAFKAHKGDVVLINGHPSVNSDFYPIFFDALFWGMAETSDLRATCRQIYNPELPPGIIPAQEAGIPVEVEVTYFNFWPDTNNSPKDVELTETISPYFYLDETNITPTPSNITKKNITYDGNGSWGNGSWGGNGSGGNGTGNGTSPGNGTGANGTRPPGTFETEIVWNFKDDQGIRKFKFIVRTYENTTKKGVVPVSKGLAKFTPPGFRGREEIRHSWTVIGAALAARLVGDRDIELDGCYPLRSSGEYFDIALCLENKEGTTAKNITVVDIVCLKSPIVDVVNQSRLPGEKKSGSRCIPGPFFVKNKIFYYYDSNNKPLYPLPDETYNTTYNYTMWNGTNITLPALKMVWHIQDLLSYDYLEPAIRYGIFSQEEKNRTISFKSDPVKNSIVLDASGGSVYTNIGTHPIPYHEYLEHGVVNVPKAKGEEIPRVEYKDIWNRNHTMNLRTVFYDIVPFPPPEEHMVVTTTFEMERDGKRLKEFPIHHDVDLKFKLKTWNGYGKYDPKTYPYRMNITKNETMIVQAIPRGVGYNIDYIDSSFNKNTSLLKMHNTSTHTILYFQQDIAGGHKEVIDINAKLSAYPTVHREGSMKVNDGARFVYHQIAVGPNRYEVFDSHVQAVFAIGNNVQVRKKVAPVYIATFGDDVYHFIRLEDPYEPREFVEDPYIKSHGFGDMAATTYVGGRINETLYHSRVSPGGRTLIRIEIDNNLGHDLENVSLVPVAPPGFTVTPDNFTTQIPPIFFDFPFINRTEIWDAWKSVYYYWVDINSSVVGGKVYQINFSFISNCSNATYLPIDFEIPPALIGVKDKSGHVEAIFGRAVNLTLSDTVVNSIVRPEDVRIANLLEKDALEHMLATGVAAPGKYNRSIVNNSYQQLRGTNFTNSGGGKIDINLPPYAQMLPWIDNNTNQKTLYLIVRANVSVNRGGGYIVNKGPAVSYVNHFNETVKIKGNNEYIEAHGPAFYYKMNVMNVECENINQHYLTGGKNNTVHARVSCYNWGDDIAQSSSINIKLPSNVNLDQSSLPGEAYSIGDMIYWTLGDIGPGSEKAVEFEFFTTPPEINKTLNRGPPDPWLLIDHAKMKFIHGYLRKPVTAQPSKALFGYLYDSDLKLESISYSHPFAATNQTHSIYAHVRNNWAFSNIVQNIKVNFSVDGTYVGTGTIPSLGPGFMAKCGIDHTFTSEGVYNIRAEIVGPELNEFFDTNNDMESTLITVDPVTLTSKPDYGTGTDTFVSYYDPELTFGDTENLKVGRVSTAGGYGTGIGVSRSYLKFDMSGIPRNALILDAKLKLYMYKSNGGNLKISTYQVFDSWTEKGLTYNSQPLINSSAMSSLVIDSTLGNKTWDITSAVQSWVPTPSYNFGIMLRSELESSYRWKEFYSSDSETELRPQLIIYFAMLENKPDITKAKLTVGDYKDRELRLEWSPVPYSFYYEIYRAENLNGPYTKLGTTWNSSNNTSDGSLNTFFYDDLDGGVPNAPVYIYTDRGGLPGTIRVYWHPPLAPEPSASYYYRIKAIDHESSTTELTKSPTIKGQLTPIISKYLIYNSTTSNGPWNQVIGESDNNVFLHTGLPQGKVMYYRIRSESSEGFQSNLSKVVWGRSNRQPAASDPWIMPTVAYTTDYLIAKYNFTDPDNDTDHGSYFNWYRDGTKINWHYYYIYPAWTAKNQKWYYTVKPKDGIEYGTEITSGVITIKNSPPKLTGVKIEPEKPSTSDNIILSYQFKDADLDSEAVTTIKWYKDGVHQSVYDNKKTVPADATSKGEVWNVSVRVSDGTDFSVWYKLSAVTVLNTAPLASNVKISPANPKTGDPITAVYTYFDTDSDTESGTEISWYKFDKLQSAYNNLLVVPASATQKGEVWHFIVKPRDGEWYGEEVTSQKVKVENTMPSVSELMLYPKEPTTTDNLYIEYNYNDPDLDPELDSVIKWYLNGEHVKELDNALQVLPEYTARDQSWKYSVTPMDGFSYGATVFSAEVLIVNSVPAIINAEIKPENPAVKDDLMVRFDAYDADGDTITNIEIIWFKNNEEQVELTDELQIPAKYTGAGESWYFKIKVSDSFGFGQPFQSKEIIINKPPQASKLILLPESPTSADELKAEYSWSDEDSSDSETNSLLKWYRNSILIDDLTNLFIVPEETTAKGEEWYFTVQPCDGKDFGVTVRSEIVKIGNTEPSCSEPEIIRSTGSNGFIYEAKYNYYDLDNDPEQDSKILWYKNNELIEELTNLRGIPLKYLSRDSIWYFTIKPYDGENYGPLIRSSSLVIENIAPVIDLAEIKPKNPITTDELVAYIEYYDPDNDDLEKFQPEYSWFKDDKLQTQLDGWSSIPAKMTAHGEVWYFKVRIYDGSEWSPRYSSLEVTIQNSLPEISDIDLSPERPLKKDIIKLQYTYTDADSDLESETETQISWFRNNELVELLNDEMEVPSDYLNPGDEWYCTILPNDGFDFGKKATSHKIMVNMAPTVEDVSINPNAPSVNDKLELTYEYSDPDLDVEGETIIRWFKNDEPQPRFDGLTIVTNKELKAGDEWYVTVQPSDGLEFGTAVKSDSVTIQSLETKISDPYNEWNDFSTVIGILIVLIVLIILAFLIVTRRRRRGVEQEFEPETITEPVQSIQAKPEPKKQIVPQYEFRAEPEISTPVIQKPKKQKTTKVDTSKTSAAIPLAVVIQNIAKESKNVELNPEPVEEYLPYDQIDIEFKCPKCEVDISPDLDFCPNCGEDFGVY